LRCIDAFNKYLEESKIKSESDAAEEQLGRKISVFTGNTFVDLEPPKAPLPVGLGEGRGRIVLEIAETF